MSAETDVTALAIDVAVPPELRWSDVRRGERFVLTTLDVRMLPDRRLATTACGRPDGGGRSGSTSLPVPRRLEPDRLVRAAADRAAALCSTHGGTG